MSELSFYTTTRLTVTPTTEADADLFLDLLNSESFIHNIGDRNVRSLEDAMAYIRERVYPQRAQCGYSSYTLTITETGEKIGTCGLHRRQGIQGVDIGFALLPRFEGKGFMTEAAEPLRDKAFGEFGIQELYGYTAHWNKASRRLLEKLGMQLVGTIYLPNDDEELVKYRMYRPNTH